MQGGAGGRCSGPGDELFGVSLAAGDLGGCGVGEGFLVEPQAAAGEPEERVCPQGDEQDVRRATHCRSRLAMWVDSWARMGARAEWGVWSAESDVTNV